MALETRLLLSVAILVMGCSWAAESISLYTGSRKKGDTLVVDEIIHSIVTLNSTTLSMMREWPRSDMTRLEVLDTTPVGLVSANVAIDRYNDPMNLKLIITNVPGNGIFYHIKVYYKNRSQ